MYRNIRGALVCALIALPFQSTVSLEAQALSGPDESGRCWSKQEGADPAVIPCSTEVTSNGEVLKVATREPFTYRPQSQQSLAAAVARGRDGDRTVLTLPASRFRDAVNRIFGFHFENNEDFALAIRQWRVAPCMPGVRHLARVVKATNQVDFGTGWQRSPDRGERCLHDERGRMILSLKCANPYLDIVVNPAMIVRRSEVAPTPAPIATAPVAGPVIPVPVGATPVDTTSETEDSFPEYKPSWWAENRKWVFIGTGVAIAVTAFWPRVKQDVCVGPNCH
jgi:hypothetical protein